MTFSVTVWGLLTSDDANNSLGVVGGAGDVLKSCREDAPVVGATVSTILLISFTTTVSGSIWFFDSGGVLLDSETEIGADVSLGG